MSVGSDVASRAYFLHGCNHIYIHGAEIACLKGLQGQQGYVGRFRREELFP